MTQDLLNSLLDRRGIVLNERQLEQFDQYYRLLVEWNDKMNLTAITDREGVYVKHFYDSVSLAFFVDVPSVRTLADIGSGAGFPSIPLKIVFPHLEVTIIDSLNKRIQFLFHLADSLGFGKEVRCVHARAEDAARRPELRDSFDLVTARAVARLNVLSEFCLPFVRPGGMFVAMKGSGAAEELKEAAYSWKQLQGKLIADESFALPIEDAQRHMIKVLKSGKTPAKFPRKAGIPLKQPLIDPRNVPRETLTE